MFEKKTELIRKDFKYYIRVMQPAALIFTNYSPKNTKYRKENFQICESGCYTYPQSENSEVFLFNFFGTDGVRLHSDERQDELLRMLGESDYM